MFATLASKMIRILNPRARRSQRVSQTELVAMESRVLPSALLGLTATNRLVQFDSDTPNVHTKSVTVHGLARRETLVSIDSRPANGLVYGLTNRNALYTLNPETGAATLVSAGAAAFPLQGNRNEIDFNPNVDRLRVVTNSDQNFRINPNNGALVDGNAGLAGVQPDTALSYAPGDVNAGKNPNVIGAAYDRNFQGTALTELYGIDSSRRTLVTIGGTDGVPSPNGGQLFTIGALGIRLGAHVGFEIDDEGIGHLSTNGRLYTVNLDTGAATETGRTGGVIRSLTSLPREEVIYGATVSNRLISFRASDPGQLLTSVPIGQLTVGETVSSIDFRPATGELFAVTSTNRVLRINPVTGQAIVVGVALDPTAFAAGSPVGLDFNPTVDRLRIVNGNGDNVRYNPVTSTAVTPADTDLAYLATDPNFGAIPVVSASAYNRNDNDPTTATTLFGIDTTLNLLVRQGAVDGAAADVSGGGSPNGGALTTLGALGVDPTDQVGFDISGAGSNGSGVGLAVIQLQGESVSKLFQINVSSSAPNQPLGRATLIGIVGGGEVLTSLAIAPPTIQFSQPTFRATERGLVAEIVITRSGGSQGTASVFFSTIPGSAQANLDFTSVSDSLVTFQPGQTTRTVTVMIARDRVRELEENVLLTLSGVTGGNTQLGLHSTAQLRIID